MRNAIHLPHLLPLCVPL